MKEVKSLCYKCGKIHSGKCSGSYSIGTKDKKYDTFLQSKLWRQLRKNILQRDRYTCTRCYALHGIINNKDLQVHHIVSRDSSLADKSLWTNPTNLITVCRQCNMELGTKNVLDYEYNFLDNNEEVNI